MIVGQETASKGAVMALAGHLDELRGRLIKTGLFFLAASFVSLAWSRKLLTAVVDGGRIYAGEFVLLKPFEAIEVYLKTALVSGIALTVPVALYEIWGFARPAFDDDAPSPVPWAAASGILFFAGAFLSYKFLLPFSLRFSLSFAGPFATPMISLSSYAGFVFFMLLAGGSAFQIPVVMTLLSRAGFVYPESFGRRRKEVAFAILAVAAIVTPTSDVVNMLLFAVPMLLLYEAGILSSRLSARPAKKRTGSEVYP